MATENAIDPGLTPPVSRLEVIDLDDFRLVYVNGQMVGYYACDDKGVERVLVTQLAEALTIDARDIAQAFGMHAVTLSRFRGQMRTGGSTALMPRKSGPKGPSKMTPQIEGRCRKLREQGMSTRAIAESVSSKGKTISHVSVAALFKAERTVAPAANQEPMASQQRPAGEEQQTALESESEPTLLAIDSHRESVAVEPAQTRYAGAMLLYASLAQLDLWNIARQQGADMVPGRWFGWADTLAMIIFCFALRFRSIEDFKNVRRRDLGVLIGKEECASVVSLRAKIKALTESIDAMAVNRELFRRYLTLEPVWEGLYYVDGHFCPYFGSAPTPSGWDAKRRLAVPGHTDVYVHDAKGRALFFFSQPLNDSLARAIPSAVEEIRRAHGWAPFTIVFDRGGYSGEAFRYLDQEGIGFITYLKGRKAERRYPRKHFRPGWFSFEGERHVYRLFEKKTRVGGAGAIRTIVFIGNEDHQVPVLTNLSPSANAAKVVHCLRLRWRQENNFKYLRENYAIDQIIQYGSDEETQDRLISNPRRKKVKEQIREIAKQLQDLEALLGRAMNENDEQRRPTVRGLKIAHGLLRRQIASKRQSLTRLENRLQRTPAQVSAAAIGKSRSLLREDRRLLVNTLKIAACNAERMLARRFNQAYDQPKDAYSVFRSLLQLPGTVQAIGSDLVEVCLQRPDSEKVARALEALLADINAEAPRMLGNGPHLNFSLDR
jgi:transposase